MKKIFKKCLICLFVFLFNSNNQAIAQIIKYQYFPRSENMVNLNGTNRIDSSYIWTSTQIFISDSVFKFGPIVCQSDTSNCCSITFKLDFENNWYIIDSNKEYLFYDNRSKRLKCIYFEQCEKLYEPCSYSQSINNQLVLSFEIRTPGYSSGDKTIYWFSEKFGIISVCSGITCFVRNDFIDILSR